MIVPSRTAIRVPDTATDTADRVIGGARRERRESLVGPTTDGVLRSARPSDQV
jgi:hypothetical protein